MDWSHYIANAYCGFNIIAKIWRCLDDVYFNVFIKHRNPLTTIVMSDLNLKPEQEELIKKALRIGLEKIMERW